MDQELHQIITNFTSGEISPLVGGRVDISKYQNTASLLTNWTVKVQGGIVRRPGWKFVEYAELNKNLDPDDDNTLLIPFIFSSDQSYVIEMGPNYIRFYSSHGMVMNGPVPYEIAHTLGTIHDYKQSADVLFILHSGGIHKLSRRGHTNWSLRAVTFRPPAVMGAYTAPDTTLTISAVTGSGVAFTSGADAFLSGEVGRVIYPVDKAGRAIITAVTDARHVTVDIIEDFENTDVIVSGAWRIEGELTTTVTASPLNGTSTITSGSNVFRVDDVGKYMSVGSGFGKIMAYLSPLSIRIALFRPISSVTSGNYVWTMHQDAWYEGNWPRSISLFDNRLVLASTPLQPTAIWASESGDFYSMAPGQDDSDGLSFTVAADQADHIRWLASHKMIMFGTASSEGKMSGGDSALTPTSVKVDLETFFGCSAVKPVLVAGAGILFVQMGERRVRELAYNWESDSLVSPNMSLLSEHMTKGGIKEVCFSKEPDPILWCLLNSGEIAGMTYERQEQVVGWHRVSTQGEIKRITCIPFNQRYEVWALIVRTLGGVKKKTVEFMEYYSPHETDIEDAFFVDCGLSGSAPSPTNTFTGAEHLAGETVQVLADGTVHPPVQVTGLGEIVLNGNYSKIQAGLPYPLSPAATSRIEMQTAMGSLQGRTKSIHHATLRLYNASDLLVGPSIAKLKPHKVATPPNLCNEDFQLTYDGGWEKDGKIYIVQNNPVPTTIIAVVIDLMVTV